MAEWRVLIVKTLDGQIVADAIPRDQPSFTRKICDKGSFTVNFLIGQRANSAIDFREYSKVGKYCWVILCDDFPVQGGPAWTYQYTENTRTLSLSGTGLQGILDKRILINWEGHSYLTHPSNDIAWDGEFKWEMQRRLALYGTAETNYGLPIIAPQSWPNQGPGNATKGTYYGYDLATVWQRMTELHETINGPEFDFIPQFTNGNNNIQWRMLVGEPILGNQTPNDVWDYGGALSRIDVDVNGGASPLARVWVKGEGTERSLLTGFAEDQSLYALGFPPIDAVDSEHTSVKIQNTLEEYADKNLEKFRYPIEKWNCSVRIDGKEAKSNRTVSPKISEIELGASPQFFVSGHPWITDGGYRKRILGYSDDGPNNIKLELDEDPSAVAG